MLQLGDGREGNNREWGGVVGRRRKIHMTKAFQLYIKIVYVLYLTICIYLTSLCVNVYCIEIYVLVKFKGMG